MDEIKVYLAGGLKTDWQDRVINALQGLGVHFYNPMTLNTDGNKDMMIIALKEQEWLSECDIVFGYLEQTNPMPLGMYAEIGYACAEGKYIIFVDEWKNHKSYWLKAFVSEDTASLEQGIQALRSSIQELYKLRNNDILIQLSREVSSKKTLPPYYLIEPCLACEQEHDNAIGDGH